MIVGVLLTFAKTVASLKRNRLWMDADESIATLIEVPKTQMDLEVSRLVEAAEKIDKANNVATAASPTSMQSAVNASQDISELEDHEHASKPKPSLPGKDADTEESSKAAARLPLRERLRLLEQEEYLPLIEAEDGEAVCSSDDWIPRTSTITSAEWPMSVALVVLATLYVGLGLVLCFPQNRFLSIDLGPGNKLPAMLLFVLQMWGVSLMTLGAGNMAALHYANIGMQSKILGFQFPAFLCVLLLSYDAADEVGSDAWWLIPWWAIIALGASTTAILY